MSTITGFTTRPGFQPEAGWPTNYYYSLIIAGGILLNEAASNPRLFSDKTPGERDVLYQVSTIDALVLGAYEGVQPVGDVEKHGDFGIGTFEALDGEMIAVDGRYYQVTSDGSGTYGRFVGDAAVCSSHIF